MSMNQPKTIHENDELQYLSYRYSWLHLIRPMTFTGSIAPILVGTTMAAKQGPIRIDIFVAILVAALLIQSTINMLNDYFDYQKGQDMEKWEPAKTVSFGMVPQYHHIPYVATIILAIVCIIGAWVILTTGYWWLAIIGTLGLIFGFYYSGGSRPLSSVGLGELMAAILFGPIPTTISYAIQGYSLNITILAISLPFSFLIASMILSNNIRDLQKDKGVRHTVPMMLGRVRAPLLLTSLLTLAYVTILFFIVTQIVAWTVGIILLALPLAAKLRHSLRVGALRDEEMSGMKWSALHHWAFGILFTIGLWL